MGDNTDAQDEVVAAIIEVICEYEDSLSDGFGYYGGDEALPLLARDILRVLVSRGVIEYPL